jgi:hypothetical protein
VFSVPTTALTTKDYELKSHIFSGPLWLRGLSRPRQKTPGFNGSFAGVSSNPSTDNLILALTVMIDDELIVFAFNWLS